MKVILCGPPHSGKSCLREGLKQALLSRAEAPYPYVITANPDGEGAWFQAAVSLDRERAMQHKAAHKGLFTDEFGQCAAEWVANCALPLALIDIGGRTTDMNARISTGATHAVILAGDPIDFPEWRLFCGRAELEILAELHSDYHAPEDVLPTQRDDGVWSGSVHGLKRGVRVEERPTIQFLAELLSRLAAGGIPQENPMKNPAPEETISYQIALEPDAVGGPILWVRFVGQHQNDQIVCDAARRLEQLAGTSLLQGAPLIRINGPASLPVMATITHAIVHSYEAIAVFDPKLNKYVVSVAHGPAHSLGELID